MNIPESILVANKYDIPSIFLFVGVGVVLWFFISWYESLKDGFNINKVFDISFWVLAFFGGSFFFLNRKIEQLTIFDPTSWVLSYDRILILVTLPLLVSLIPIYVFSKINKWSLFRLLDIYSVSFSSVVMTVSLGYVLVYKEIVLIPMFLIGLIFSFVVARYRGYKFMSGTIFSFFLILTSVVGLSIYRPEGYLPFYISLITIGLVNLYLRLRKNMIVNKNIQKNLQNIPANMLKALQDILTKKDESLEKEERLLIDEDPHKDPSRVTDNSEEMDDAILEDGPKELSDLRLAAITNMRVQIKKALAFMKLGKYGTCEICGEPIDKARLKIYPEATKCYSCANKER